MSEAAPLAVLDALCDGALHSGEVLATCFGISRAALAKRIDHLREWGLDVQAQPGMGYRLAQPLERLVAARIAERLSPGHRALRVVVLPRTDSTNTQLLHADPTHDPQALWAESQTGGRGRRGRQWVSPFGSNLYLSVAWTFPAWPARLGTLSLAVAVAVARVVTAAGIEAVRIKWPNDLLVAGRKLAGILIEPRGEVGGPCRVVIGIGLNVAMSSTQAGAVEQPWISLHEAAAGRGLPGRNVLAAALLEELLSVLRHFEQYGFAPFAAEWAARDALAGQPVRAEGAAPVEGLACGLDADGGLVIETPQGRQTVHAGDVSVRRT